MSSPATCGSRPGRGRVKTESGTGTIVERSRNSLYSKVYNEGTILKFKAENKWTWLAAAVLSGGLCLPAVAADKLIVFAAASLREALFAVVQQYQQESATQIVESYAGSSTLARQIERPHVGQ